MDYSYSRNPGKMGKDLIQDFRAKEDHLRVRLLRAQSTSVWYLFPLCNPSGTPRTLLGVLTFVLITFCEYVGVWVGLWVRSGVQLSRSEVSRLVFLGEVELGVQKLGHRCALKLWKGSSRELGEDKEGIWIRV